MVKQTTRKYLKRKTYRKRGGTKRRGEIETDLHASYQPLIDAIGTENILESFAYALGREGLKFIGQVDDNLPIANRVRKVGSIPPDFSGVAFDGAHWKGYEPTRPDGSRTIYDSYAQNIQLPGSNNFCQSYATFLWARKGNLHFEGPDINIKLIPGEYAYNVKQMSLVWLSWVETMSQFKDSAEWLKKAIPPPFNIKQIKSTLMKLSKDDSEAAKFSISR